jgi:ribosome-interacting GTPase 1
MKLHKDFVSRFRFARVWGRSAKFDGMVVRKFGHVLEDNDIVEIHLS